MMDAMDSGADDFEAEDCCFTIYTRPDDFSAVMAVHRSRFCIGSNKTNTPGRSLFDFFRGFRLSKKSVIVKIG